MKIVNVELYNRTAYFDGIGSRTGRRLRRHFRFHPDKYQYMPKYRDGKWDGWITMLKRDRATGGYKVNSGLFLALQESIERKEKIKFAIQDMREFVRFNDDNILSDRIYQNLCIRAMQRERSGGLILSATASGKTLIAGLYFKALIGTGCFVVDELTLLEQAREALSEVIGEEVGKVGEQVFNPKRITVATIQTLHLHKDRADFKSWMDALNVVIIDELHIALNRRNIETVKAAKPHIVFGLTATLELQKEMVRIPAYALCGPTLFEYHQEEGTEEGFLAPGIVCAVKVIQEGLLGSYHPEYQDLITESDVRNDCIVGLVKESIDRGRHVVVIVERVAHLRRLSKMVGEIPHKTVFGEKKTQERIMAKKGFERGEIRLIICNKVFKKGVDIKIIDTIIECSALSSKNDAIQKFGRGKRTKAAKDGLIYIDINDRSPFRSTRDSDDWNRFHKASKSRLAAFRRRNVPITIVNWDDNPEEVLDIAEAKLQRYIRKLRRNTKNVVFH